MSQQKKTKKNILRKRIVGAYASSVISIALVLLLVGFAAAFAFNVNSIENYFKENIHLTAFLKPKTREADALKLQKELEKERFVKSTRYVSVEQGTAELVDMLGEDFVSVFATSPVPSSIEVLLKAEYLHPDSLKTVISSLEKRRLIDSVNSQTEMIQSVGDAMTRLGLLLLVLVALLLFISVVLISNVVRLNIYSNRFSIHTMQLVGASNSYISRPFLGRASLMGLWSALIACAVLALGLYFAWKAFPVILELLQPQILIYIALGLVAFGVLLCLVRAAAVMGRMTKLQKDELYG